MHRAAANYYFCDPELIHKVMQDCHTTLYYYYYYYLNFYNIIKATRLRLSVHVGSLRRVS